MKFVTATDDDDDIAGEIATDLIIGVGMAICEEFVACKLFMIIAGLASAIVITYWPVFRRNPLRRYL